MKKVICWMLILMLVLANPLAQAEEISISAPDVKPIPMCLNDVNWQKSNGYYILTVSCQAQGDQWEACLTGLSEKLSDSQIRLLLSAAMQGKGATVTADGLIDVEKATNKLPLEFGKKYITDEISEDPMWGDSKHCWAASIADMLELTGWIRFAADPETGERFRNADELFGFFNRTFYNTGAYHSAAMDWVFTGTESNELATPRIRFKEPLIKGFSSSNIWSEFRTDDCASLDEYLNRLSKRLMLLKQGYALGGVLNLCPFDFPLKSYPSALCAYNSSLKSFVTMDFLTIPWDDTVESLFVPDAENGMPIPVAYDPETDSYYEKESRAKVDPMEVWIGRMVFNEEQQCWYCLDPHSSEDTGAFYVCYNRYDPADVDLEHPIKYPRTSGGSHAVTVMGYVQNLSEKVPARRIRGIFLADSDSDASFYRLDQSNIRREDRPNRYILYPTSIVSAEEGDSFTLDGFLSHGQVLLNTLTALNPVLPPVPDVPPEPQPVPKTGDGFPMALFLSAWFLSSAALILLLRRKDGEAQSGK